MNLKNMVKKFSTYKYNDMNISIINFRISKFSYKKKGSATLFIKYSINNPLIWMLFFILPTALTAQSFTIKGKIEDDKKASVPFANVVLYDNAVPPKMVRAEASDLDGNFSVGNVEPGNYKLQISFLGLEDKMLDLSLENRDIDMGLITMKQSGVQLETTVITAKRALVEVKPDRTVFNVEGTINSAGDNAFGLLRKAPGILVDNNNNVSVLGRTGVLVYVDGKKLPLTGDDLTNYLESISSEQIDKIDIISNPGARYEAQGNAGIIDIRLRRNKNYGTNGNLSGAYSQGEYGRYSINAGLNNRSEKFNFFGSGGFNINKGYSNMLFQNEQNGLYMNESNRFLNERNGINGKLGLDYYISKNSTIGFLYSGNIRNSSGKTFNRVEISPLTEKNIIDSILIANNENDRSNDDHVFNINYAYKGKKSSTLNIDLDYGRYDNEGLSYQPNEYFDPTETVILSGYFSEYETPVSIDIYTFKLDFEQDALGGKLGAGTKISRVNSDNVFKFYELNEGDRVLVQNRSNEFNYDESVYAGYVNYNRTLSKKISLSAGIRGELTDALGVLTAFDPSQQEDPVDLFYFQLFPSVGLSYNVSMGNTLNINYGRRVNRPDYQVLNPFREQLSELSFSKGNPFLRPEIVNNYEIGYTMFFRYNIKMSYSRTNDQITRLMGPEPSDPRASFISWDNLTIKDVYALNLALPFQFTKWWNAFFNVNGSFIDHQADYGNGAVIDIQAWSYNVFSQHTFNLPFGLTGELSGWYSGPGIWGGVFIYEPSWSLNVGLQKKFFKNAMNVKLSGEDLFYQSGWSGYSAFNGLKGIGQGNWDSRRVSLSVSYSFGNSAVKSRNRKTGIEEETKRLGGEGGGGPR